VQHAGEGNIDVVPGTQYSLWGSRKAMRNAAAIVLRFSTVSPESGILLASSSRMTSVFPSFAFGPGSSWTQCSSRGLRGPNAERCFDRALLHSHVPGVPTGSRPARLSALLADPKDAACIACEHVEHRHAKFAPRLGRLQLAQQSMKDPHELHADVENPCPQDQTDNGDCHH
jgi:hypothetical protein